MSREPRVAKEAAQKLIVSGASKIKSPKPAATPSARRSKSSSKSSLGRSKASLTTPEPIDSPVVVSKPLPKSDRTSSASTKSPDAAAGNGKLKKRAVANTTAPQSQKSVRGEVSTPRGCKSTAQENIIRLGNKHSSSEKPAAAEKKAVASRKHKSEPDSSTPTTTKKTQRSRLKKKQTNKKTSAVADVYDFLDDSFENESVVKRRRQSSGGTPSVAANLSVTASTACNATSALKHNFNFFSPASVGHQRRRTFIKKSRLRVNNSTFEADKEEVSGEMQVQVVSQEPLHEPAVSTSSTVATIGEDHIIPVMSIDKSISPISLLSESESPVKLTSEAIIRSVPVKKRPFDSTPLSSDCFPLEKRAKTSGEEENQQKSNDKKELEEWTSSFNAQLDALEKSTSAV